MANRTVQIPPFGEVLLSKRRGAKNLRLSVTAKGQVRVSLPAWAPYSAGISFAKSRQDWILQQLSTHSLEPISSLARIGKYHSVVYVAVEGRRIIKVRIKDNVIEVKTSEPFSSGPVQERLLAACEKALKAEALQLLPQRLDLLAKRFGFSYKELKVRKLVSRWGSCSKDGTITLSYYLMQLPWELIDYVILHELTHTEHLHHGKGFWDALGKILPSAKSLKKQIRDYKPQVRPL